jgi:superoxide reductase
MVKNVNEVYKCTVCGNMVEVVKVGGGELVCCKQPMELLEEKTADSSTEKHVPVKETGEHGVEVTVGSVPHPMTEEHSIQWIEVVTEKRTYRTYLKPGQEPKASFCVEEPIVAVREYCDLHGLWKAE